MSGVVDVDEMAYNCDPVTELLFGFFPLIHVTGQLIAPNISIRVYLHKS